MTYNEWRDELKNNLLSVTEDERRRVLDYYAEAYADRREAGFTEREIIQDFGAPYDAAQRILQENDDFDIAPRRTPRQEEQRHERHYRDAYYEPQPQPQAQQAQSQQSQAYSHAQQAQPQQPHQQSASTEKTATRENYTWVFVLLCIIFAVPLFGLVMAMVGVTIGLCVAPFSLLATGVARVFAGIGLAMTNVAGGFAQIGVGLIAAGIGVALIPLSIWLVKTMWKLFKSFFRWLRRMFSGKEDL